MNEVETILVLVKLTDGTIRQVLSSKTQKELALKMLICEDGNINLSKDPVLGISF